MPIRFACPACLAKLFVDSRKAGAVVDCPKCHARVRVPDEVRPILEGIPLTAGPSTPPPLPTSQTPTVARANNPLSGRSMPPPVAVRQGDNDTAADDRGDD